MKIHLEEKILEIKRAREDGLSINEISKKFSIPKTTVWHHVHKIQISEEQRKSLVGRQGGSKIRSQKDWQKAFNESRNILDGLGDIKPIFPILLSALYWAEGRKEDGFEFINTDRRMIRVFLKILREYFRIGNERITPVLRINSSMDLRKCLEYWSKATELSIESFLIDINDKNNKTKSIYGLCRIRIKKGGYMLKLVTSLIARIFQNIEGDVNEIPSRGVEPRFKV